MDCFDEGFSICFEDLGAREAGGGFLEGDNPDRKQWANFGVKPEDQHTGIFAAPHGIAFAKNGDLYVQDWNATGRVTKLRRK